MQTKSLYKMVVSYREEDKGRLYGRYLDDKQLQEIEVLGGKKTT